MRAFVLLTILSGLGLLVTPAVGTEPDPTEIIAKADQATKAVKAISYKAKVWTESEFKFPQPRIEATVKAKENAPGKAPLFWIDGVATLPQRGASSAFHVILNDTQAAVVDKQEKVCTIGELPEAFELVSQPLKAVVMRELFHATPFSDELSADSSTYEGKRTIGGTECHVVYVVYQGGAAEARWYFGVNDFLPHRVDRVSPGSGGKTFRALELSEIDTSPEFDGTTFAIHVPAGYQRRHFGLLQVGSEAPDWTLKSPTGEAVTLSKLRGKVVVLDFWATWCGPCRAAMPKLQKLYEKYRGKPVLVYGINTWERGDAAAFMKKNKLEYGLLLEGDPVAQAYGVRGIPTFYLIGPAGKILHASSGFDPSAENAATKLIDAALAKIK